MKHHLASVSLLAAIAAPAVGWPLAWADPVPSVSISLDDGARETTPGAENTYTLRLSNQGGDRLKRVLLVQSLPPSMTFVKADAGGRVERDKVAWTVNVLPRKETVVHLSARVGAVAGAAEARNLATTACARRSAAGPVLVCATDVNTVASPETTDWVLPISLAAAAAAGLATTAFLLRRRRRRSQPA